MDLNIPTETTAEILIRYGLYIGAIFQLICIAAVMVLPDKDPEGPIYGKGGETSEDEIWGGGTGGLASPRHGGGGGQHRMKKHDKKKRR